MSTKVTLLTTLALLLLGAALGEEVIIEEGLYVILDHTVQGDSMEITITANTTGYIGFGISPDGTMTGADLLIAGYDNVTRAGYIGDYYGVGSRMPVLDDVQNVQLVSASETETSTTIVFRRSLTNSADSVQDLALEDREQYIIWSIGENDTVAYHARNRGSVLINLLDH